MKICCSAREDPLSKVTSSAAAVTIYFWIVVYSFFKDLTDGGGFWKNRSGREIKV